MCGGSASLAWYAVTMAQRKKATVMLPLFHLSVELAEWAFPVAEEMAEEFRVMKLVMAILGKALFVHQGSEARVLLSCLQAVWPDVHRLFPELICLPTFKEIMNFFEAYLVSCPDAHRSMGLKLEAMHQIVKKGRCALSWVITGAASGCRAVGHAQRTHSTT